MGSALDNVLIRKLEKRDHLSDDERAVLQGFGEHVREFQANEELVGEGDRPWESKLLLEGFVARFKALGDGRRQITALHVPGDFVDLHSFLLKRMDHGIVALTPCIVAPVSHDKLQDVTETHAHLTRMLWLSTLLDAALQRQWIVMLARHDPRYQLAHILCELYLRLQAVDLIDESAFRCGIAEGQFCDMLGGSTADIGPIFEELQASGLVTWADEMVVIEDWQRLSERAEFDPTYLNLELEPR
jgi:CRP-like cAMP-binding protein